MDCSPPGSSVHGILQASILEWVTMPSSRGSSQPRDQTRVSLMSPALTGRFFATSTTWEAPIYQHYCQMSSSIQKTKRVPHLTKPQGLGENVWLSKAISLPIKLWASGQTPIKSSTQWAHCSSYLWSLLTTVEVRSKETECDQWSSSTSGAVRSSMEEHS